MFNKIINETPLTGDTADRLFSNIIDSGTLDKSFLATLRVLLRKRLTADENVNLRVIPLYHYPEEIESRTVSVNVNSFIPDAVKYPAAAHNIFIIYTTDSETGKKMLELLRANAGTGKRYLSRYALCEDLRIFYARKLNALFYRNDVDKSTVIFTDKLELKHFHALQMMIPKYLPSLFKDNPLNETETALLKSTGNKSASEYELLIEETVKNLDIRAEIIRTKLAGFETSFERIKLDEIKNEIYVYESSYENQLSIMRELAVKIQDRRYTLAGLESAINEHSDDSELMEYFMCNKNLSIIRVNGTAIEFVINGYADIYDADAFELYVGNHGGYMYNKINPTVTKPQMERLYKAIFNERKFKLRLCAAYTADMRTGLRALKQYMFPSESRTYLPNPHIQHFGCIGSYAGRFQEYMRKRDYIGAIDQAVVSARNLNFYDSTVISTFAGELSRTSISCIEKQDGTLLTPLEAIKETEEPCQDL